MENIDRLEFILREKEEEYKKEKMEQDKKIKSFCGNPDKVYNEQHEEAQIELNTEETKLQKDLMDDILKEIDDVQKKIKEIKETNQFEVPRTIRNRYPTAYSINVFSLIKMIEDYKFILTIKLWLYKNNQKQMRAYLDQCYNILEQYDDLSDTSKHMIEIQIEKFLEANKHYTAKKNLIYESIVSLSTAYIEIDAILEDEIKEGEVKKNLGILYSIFPCLLKIFHDNSWLKNSFINHIYESQSSNTKKLAFINTFDSETSHFDSELIV